MTLRCPHCGRMFERSNTSSPFRDQCPDDGTIGEYVGPRHEPISLDKTADWIDST